MAKAMSRKVRALGQANRVIGSPQTVEAEAGMPAEDEAKATS